MILTRAIITLQREAQQLQTLAAQLDTVVPESVRSQVRTAATELTDAADQLRRIIDREAAAS